MADALANRRAVLLGLCGIAVAGLGSVLLADDALAAPGIIRKPNGQVVVAVKKVLGLAAIGGAVNLGVVKGISTAVVRTGAGTYEAIDLRCTHAGTTVEQAGGAWSCPSHGSQFAIDGAVTGGPAARSLARVNSSLKGGTLTVG